jgi:hypothetical protein
MPDTDIAERLANELVMGAETSSAEEKAEEKETKIQETGNEIEKGEERESAETKGEEEPSKKVEVTSQPAFRDRAIAKAKEIYGKGNPGITDAQIEEQLYKGFLGAQKQIGKAVEKANAMEAEARRLEGYKTWSETVIGMLKAGQIIGLDASGNVVNIQMPRAENDEFLSSEAKSLKIMEDKLDAFIRQSSEEKKKNEEAKRLAELSQQLDNRVKAEVAYLCDPSKFPFAEQLKTWLEEKRKTGQTPFELDEIYDLMEEQGVSFTAAAKLYFYENQFPAVIQKTKQETIQKMKKKAGENAEIGDQVVNQGKQIPHMKDAQGLAETLFALADT